MELCKAGPHTPARHLRTASTATTMTTIAGHRLQKTISYCPRLADSIPSVRFLMGTLVTASAEATRCTGVIVVGHRAQIASEIPHISSRFLPSLVCYASGVRRKFLSHQSQIQQLSAVCALPEVKGK